MVSNVITFGNYIISHRYMARNVYTKSCLSFKNNNDTFIEQWRTLSFFHSYRVANGLLSCWIEEKQTDEANFSSFLNAVKKAYFWWKTKTLCTLIIGTPQIEMKIGFYSETYFTTISTMDRWVFCVNCILLHYSSSNSTELSLKNPGKFC